jgi:cytochrome o ubiquinol oxidase operon protein cyoD
MSQPNNDKRQDLRGYVTGYVLALLLTAAAFGIVFWPHSTSNMTAIIVFGLALAQAAVHFRFFLHVSFKTSARDDLQLIIFSILIVGLMISGTLVILMNLHRRMM